MGREALKGEISEGGEEEKVGRGRGWGFGETVVRGGENWSLE